MPGQKAGVVDVVEAAISHGAAREEEGLAGGFAEGGTGGERGTIAHQVADRIADDGVRAVDGPAKAVAGGGVHHDVFEFIVEVLLGQARRVLAEGGDGGDVAAILERAGVVLGACHQADMAQALAGICNQDRAQHSAIQADVVGLGLAEGPGAVEDMGRVEVGNLGGGIRGQQVDRSGGHLAGAKGRAARQAGDLPTADVAQMLGHDEADNAGRSDDEGAVLVHGILRLGQGVNFRLWRKSLKGHE
jgi:hypothetical protein